MTAFFGAAFILTALICIPFTFLFAARDTDHLKAIRRECQQDALLDWTDKDVLSSLHSPHTPAPASAPVAASPIDYCELRIANCIIPRPTR